MQFIVESDFGGPAVTSQCSMWTVFQSRHVWERVIIRSFFFAKRGINNRWYRGSGSLFCTSQSTCSHTWSWLLGKKNWLRVYDCIACVTFGGIDFTQPPLCSFYQIAHQLVSVRCHTPDYPPLFSISQNVGQESPFCSLIHDTQTWAMDTKIKTFPVSYEAIVVSMDR
jgi:hypothetical protein